MESWAGTAPAANVTSLLLSVLHPHTVSLGPRTLPISPYAARELDRTLGGPPIDLVEPAEHWLRDDRTSPYYWEAA